MKEAHENGGVPDIGRMNTEGYTRRFAGGHDEAGRNRMAKIHWVE